jgi:hypothetical protein
MLDTEVFRCAARRLASRSAFKRSCAFEVGAAEPTETSSRCCSNRPREGDSRRVSCCLLVAAAASETLRRPRAPPARGCVDAMLLRVSFSPSSLSSRYRKRVPERPIGRRSCSSNSHSGRSVGSRALSIWYAFKARVRRDSSPGGVPACQIIESAISPVHKKRKGRTLARMCSNVGCPCF